ncbi:IGF-like family receptor 1 isoform X2 [Acomys russatus]|uniref:IGF-like family receptor 1 isoform X2 n=1 Tax=Acomys russatus TaxID=60746 RepID=UPI0021E1E662|nr:IGF-like family receptor 1 isoform X2 [Acomys russatus]
MCCSRGVGGSPVVTALKLQALPRWGPAVSSGQRRWQRCFRLGLLCWESLSSVAGSSTGTPARSAAAAACNASGLLHVPKPTPPKDACPLTAEEAGVSSSPVRWSLEQTTKSDVPRPGFASPSALPLFLGLLLGLLLVLAVALLLSLFKRKARSPPCPSLAGGDLSASAPWPSPGTLEVLGKRNSGKPALLRLSAGVSRGQPCPGGKAVKAVLPLLAPPCSSEPQGLASQPLSRLLDELEVLEELIMLLDPEPGPSGSMAYGTTRHLAARYGLPAAWSTFAYSLRPSRSPLRALIEMVVAREPSATVGQLGMHLAQLGRADALQVLCRLG